MTTSKKKEVLTPGHRLWEQFVEHLEGTEGCDFKNEPGRGYTWRCDNSRTRPMARKILQTMEEIDVEGTLNFFDTKGGHCDCEILFNVNPD